jgi:hypothetical protein
MRSIPEELELAMSIDGAGYLRRYFQLALPLARPALGTVAIFAFIGSWNNFIFPLVLTTTDSNRTLPLAVSNYEGEYSINVPAVLTVVVLSALPLILFYLLQRRNFIQGLTMGAQRSITAWDARSGPTMLLERVKVAPDQRSPLAHCARHSALAGPLWPTTSRWRSS